MGGGGLFICQEEKKSGLQYPSKTCFIIVFIAPRSICSGMGVTIIYKSSRQAIMISLCKRIM